MGERSAIEFEALVSRLESSVRGLGVRSINAEVLATRPVANAGLRFELGNQEAHLGAFLPGARRNKVEAELGDWGLSCAELVGHVVRLDGSLQFSPRFNCVEFVISRLTPTGIGQEAARVAAVRRRLADVQRQAVQRRFAPLRVGAIAGANGAGLEDFEAVLARSEFAYELQRELVPLVGPHAASGCCAAIRKLALTQDVIVLVRGGGAAASFATFDDEQLVRTISGCSVPVLCGTGHERDARLTDEYAFASCVSPADVAHQLIEFWKEDAALLQDAAFQVQASIDAALARMAPPPPLQHAHVRSQPRIYPRLIPAVALATLILMPFVSSWWITLMLAATLALLAWVTKAQPLAPPPQHAVPEAAAPSRTALQYRLPLVCTPDDGLAWLDSLPVAFDGFTAESLRVLHADIAAVLQQSLAAFRHNGTRTD